MFGGDPESQPVISIDYEDLVDNLKLHIERLSEISDSSIQASSPTVLFVSGEFADVRRRLLKYGQRRKFCVKCLEAKHTLVMTKRRRRYGKQKSLKRARAVPAPATPPELTAPVIPASSPFPPPVQADPSRKSHWHLVDQARRRRRSAHHGSCAVLTPQVRASAPPAKARSSLSPPPPPPPPPAATSATSPRVPPVSSGTARIARKLRQTTHQHLHRKHGWPAKRKKSVETVAPWRRASAASSAPATSSGSADSLKARAARIKGARNRFLGVL